VASNSKSNSIGYTVTHRTIISTLPEGWPMPLAMSTA
jgi:hypothetical protein